MKKTFLYGKLGVLSVGLALLCIDNVAQAEDRHQAAGDHKKIYRALSAVPVENGGVHVSWRWLADGRNHQKWRLWRDNEVVAEGRDQVATSVIDDEGVPGDVYELRHGWKTVAWVEVPETNYHEILLDKPADRTAPDGEVYSYTANDASIGDLDGDGDYEIILKWYPTIAKDNAFGGYTGNTLLDAYTLEGERLWRIDLGPNIRSGAHYTQFMVDDFDGDGKAELIVKTADGTRDAAGKVIGDPDADWLEAGDQVETGDRTGSIELPDGSYLAELKGRILRGPEYLTAFDGLTGKAISTVDYIPQRAPDTNAPGSERMAEIWGDGYANRSDRFLAAVGDFSGGAKSAVFARGYYGRSVIAAFDLLDDQLVTRWVFDSDQGPENYGGMGNHQVSVLDVDDDGLDEVVYGAMAIDDDGTPLWTSGLGHGDALHVADLDPLRPGLERFGVHETMSLSGNRGSAMLDAATGEILWSTPADRDTGRGVCIDIDPAYPGSECWMSGNTNLYSAQGEVIAERRPPAINFAIYWDGDLLREILDNISITKWDPATLSRTSLLEAIGTLSNNGTKATPTLSADILGDWREEVILRQEDDTALRIYLTPYGTDHYRAPLMKDSTYRNGVLAQNTAYNQPPHLTKGAP